MILLPVSFLPPRFLPLGFMPDDGRRYHVYTRETIDGEDTLLDTIPASGGEDYELVVTGDPDSEQFIHVVAVNRLGREDGRTARPRLRRVAFDSAGDLILPAPNVPVDVSLVLGANGNVTVRFRYSSQFQEVAPEVFNVYVAEGVAAMSFVTPADTASYSAGQHYYEIDLGEFAHGTTVRVVVRAQAAAADGSVETANTDEVSAVADDLAPDMPAGITVEVN
ncbi:MAG: hypothetical protein IT445_03040 [Phycisphaeraceae bacterium]|nr:hypothetical protein [Phycisphaeraceae bacterium]